MHLWDGIWQFWIQPHLDNDNDDGGGGGGGGNDNEDDDDDIPKIYIAVDILTDTPSTLDQQLVDSQPSVD